MSSFFKHYYDDNQVVIIITLINFDYDNDRDDDDDDNHVCDSNGYQTLCNVGFH